MAADGQVIFEINGDPSNINQTVRQVTGNIQNESKKWYQAVDESTGNAGKSFLNWKTVASGAVAAIGAAVLKFGKEAIDAASDLSEVQNVVDTVFGESARVIDSWSQKAGEKFGLTETQAKRFTSTLGAMMKSSGLAGKEIVGMSTDLAGLAADMASFYNLDFETAFEKIRSGISGETEPLKQLGINMSVANLEAFALAQGLEKTFSEMTQGEQVMLRYQYMMQATADAQGDFEKTSDGFANAQRRIQSSLESIKTSVGKLLIEPFANATAGVADFLAKIAADMMPEKTVIDEFNEAHIDAEQKLADIQATYDQASDLIKILKEIEQETVTLQDGTTISLSSLFGDLGEIEKAGGNIEEYIAGLGLDVEYVVLQYNKWKEATRQLTSAVPSLTNQIDSETGAINGGTDALQKNLDEWKRNEENKVYWAEYYAKAEAVARAKGEQAGIQITARAKQLAAERARKQMEDMSTTPGLLQHDLSWYGDRPEFSKFTGGQYTQEQQAWNDTVDNYIRLNKEASEAQKKAENSANDLADAETLLADELAATEEITGETLQTVQQVSDANKDAADSAEEWSKEQKNAGRTAVEAADSALKALADYIQGVRDSTAQAVNSVVNGFEKVGRAGDELREKQQQISKETGEAEIKYTSEVASLRQKFGEGWMERLQTLGEESKEWKNLSDAEREAYNALVKLRNEQSEVNKELEQYKPQTMMENLESQKTFMENYLADLQQAQEMGLSSDFLASLSDGSKESAEYLHNLVEAGPDAAREVSDLYDEVQEQKKSFTDALADQKLAADQTYDALVQKAIEAIDELNLGAEAEEAMSDTVGGLAQGIADKVPEVQAAVDSIEAQLNRLSGLGFSFSIGGFNIDFEGSLFPHFKGGTDWVPRDNFPAFLDYGEAVLTAEENKIWQMFKNGNQPTTMDYDALGGVMRENVKTGGDVYLDGRTVGHVISDAQGRSYRALQRSGWQQ
jgi:hypothetical protein